jgi:hypothetical protein
MSPFKFGHFDAICERAALTICPLIGTELGVMPTCYSRNVQLGSQIIFQPGKSAAASRLAQYTDSPATCFVHIAALAMTAIMLFHVRSKYTAVGRKEIVLFFYIYMFVELLAIFLDSAIIPTSNNVYPVSLTPSTTVRNTDRQWFTAVYAGALGALYWCILINGFVGFQFHEDGTPMSLWVSATEIMTGPRSLISSCDSLVWLCGVSASSWPSRRSSSSLHSLTGTQSACSSPTCCSPPFAPSFTPSRNWSLWSAR